MIKSFAHFKRFVCVGMTLRCEHFERPAISGPRKIVKVQTNGIWYEWTKPDGKPYKGYCGWPNSVKGVTVEPTSVTFLDSSTGKPIFTYHITDEPIPEQKSLPCSNMREFDAVMKGA